MRARNHNKGKGWRVSDLESKTDRKRGGDINGSEKRESSKNQ